MPVVPVDRIFTFPPCTLVCLIVCLLLFSIPEKSHINSIDFTLTFRITLVGVQTVFSPMFDTTSNNVENHGPGGQGSYDDPSEADPCFAKVIEGFDAVDRMHQSKVKPGNYKRMEHFVAIKSMRILPKDEGAAVAVTEA